MELCGFLLLTTGMFVHNGAVRVFFWKYEDKEDTPTAPLTVKSDAPILPA
jgi:hypothetical protein